VPETDYTGKLRRGAAVVFNVTAAMAGVATLCVAYLMLPEPARTSAGSRGAKPIDYAFVLASVPATVAVALAFVAAASLLARRSRGGPTATIAGSAFALVLSVIGSADFLGRLGHRPWSVVVVSAAALFDNFLVRALASLVFGLGVAALFETRPAPRSPRVAWLVRRPLRIGTAVGVLAFGVHAVACFGRS
jgi:hypothetical protein